MRIATYVVLAVLAATLFGAQGVGQSVKRVDAVGEKKDMFATNECFSKGGLGIIGGHLYIAVKSVKNELLFGARETWAGPVRVNDFETHAAGV